MSKISSKYLNLEGLSALIESAKDTSPYDGALILTSAGIIAGKLSPVFSETDIPTAAELVYDYKESYMNGCINNKEDVEVIGDGSLLVIKEALVKYGNNPALALEEITIHCSDVIGFSPINLDSFKKQL
ncbi:hypothetical protein ACQPU1_08700 [Clostridium paraputrificum]|uniref:hypothetical protein n=1 Tax=Clostridium TaxID=1485 RepID=UPI003D34E8A4